MSNLLAFLLPSHAHTGISLLFKPFKQTFAHMAWLSLLTNVLMLVPTIYMLQLYDRVMVSFNTLTLIAVTLMVMFLIAMMALAEWIRSIHAIKAGVRFDITYGQQVFSAAFSAAGQALQAPAQALKDLTAVRQFMTGNGLFAFFDMPWSVVYIAVLFILSPVLGATAVVFCMIQLALAIWNQQQSQAPLKSYATAQQQTDLFLHHKVRHSQTSHVMGMFDALFKRWQAFNRTLDEQDAYVQHIQNRSQFVNKFVRYTMQSLMLAIAAVLTVRGEISVGSMIASNVLIGRALQPFDVIVLTWRQYIIAKTAAGNLNDLLTRQLEHVQSRQTLTHTSSTVDRFNPPLNQVLPNIDKEPAFNSINLKELGVRLGNTDVLKRISVEILPGRILNIMGPSGSGKTTLARTLVGLLAPTSGQYQLGQQLIQTQTGLSTFTSVGYLPQRVSLLEGTIAENVARFGMLESEHIIAACSAVGMHEAVLRLPQGYDTRLDELGAPLSGGQRQLIGLARAIYKEPSLIVLDEPNASLDELGETSLMLILQTLKAKQKTIVLISHRSSLLKVTDDLLILKQGEVAHCGPRDAGIAYLNQLQTISVGSAA
jgi:ATP-binding cassette, subfamily C, bacterial exporter for protease/lipase